MPRFEILQFLEYYHQYPCLWDKNDPDFRIREKRDAAEEVLLSVFGIPSRNELRSKIRSIRCTYNQEIVKIKRSLLNSHGTEVHKPKLAWFEYADSFLKKNREDEEDSTYTYLEVCLAPEKLGGHEEEKKEEDTPAEIPVFQATPTCSQQKRKSPPLLPEEVPPNKFNKRTKIMTSAIDVAIHKLSEISDKLNEEDAFDQFGKYISAELRQLPSRQSILLQQQLQNTIAQFKLALC